jgi:hypothetical protein
MSKFTFSCTCSRHGARQSDTSRAYDVSRAFRISHRPACLASCACIRMLVCASHFARRAHARLARAALCACRPRRSPASSPSPGASLKTSRHMAATATTARFTKRSSPHLKPLPHSHLYAVELEHRWFTAHLAAHEPPVRSHPPATRARGPSDASTPQPDPSPSASSLLATPTGACPPARARHAGACIHPPPGSGPPGARVFRSAFRTQRVHRRPPSLRALTRSLTPRPAPDPRSHASRSHAGHPGVVPAASPSPSVHF